MNKNYLIFIFLIIFSGLNYVYPVQALRGTYSLSPYTYIPDSNFMGNLDPYKWSFSSTSSAIMVIALTQQQYDAFYNLILSDYTAWLNKHSFFSDSGTWHPPSIDTWHILFINIGISTTSITINTSVVFITIPLIVVGIIGLIIAIIAAITVKRKKNNKKKQEFIKELIPHRIPETQKPLLNTHEVLEIYEFFKQLYNTLHKEEPGFEICRLIDSSKTLKFLEYETELLPHLQIMYEGNIKKKFKYNAMGMITFLRKRCFECGAQFISIYQEDNQRKEEFECIIKNISFLIDVFEIREKRRRRDEMRTNGLMAQKEEEYKKYLEESDNEDRI